MNPYSEMSQFFGPWYEDKMKMGMKHEILKLKWIWKIIYFNSLPPQQTILTVTEITFQGLAVIHFIDLSLCLLFPHWKKWHVSVSYNVLQVALKQWDKSSFFHALYQYIEQSIQYPSSTLHCIHFIPPGLVLHTSNPRILEGWDRKTASLSPMQEI